MLLVLGVVVGVALMLVIVGVSDRRRARQHVPLGRWLLVEELDGDLRLEFGTETISPTKPDPTPFSRRVGYVWLPRSTDAFGRTVPREGAS